MNQIAITCACGRTHTLDCAPDPGDPRGDLVMLADGWRGIAGATLMRWAREGRLVAHRLERGRLASWERDVRAAVEAEPYTPSPAASDTGLAGLADLEVAS